MATTLYGDPGLSLMPTSNPPEKPQTPQGQNSGKVNVEYMYTTSCNEPDGDNVRYLFDWGDGNITITEYYKSEETVKESYKWDKQGSFNIRVRAQDDNGVWSEWSDPLSVTMPKNKPLKTLYNLEALNIIYQKFQLIKIIFSQ
jgi:hypothetical protein